ncbi:MAG: YeeE/YedE family protein [Phycisphaerae bacterium]|nr:YeeE/YedE family protein [Phycisphaerae bacterium]
MNLSEKFPLLCAIGILFGVGFGFFVQRAGLCFAHGLGEIFIGRGKRILRLFLVIFILTSIGFLLSGYIYEWLGLDSTKVGLKPIGQIRGYGFYNVLSGILFGAGILLNGGCILGTLRQIGEGNLLFLVVFVSFIPGMAVVVYGLNPWLEGRKADVIQNALLPGLAGVQAAYVTGVLVVLGWIWFYFVRRKTNGSLKG